MPRLKRTRVKNYEELTGVPDDLVCQIWHEFVRKYPGMSRDLLTTLDKERFCRMLSEYSPRFSDVPPDDIGAQIVCLGKKGRLGNGGKAQPKGWKNKLRLEIIKDVRRGMLEKVLGFVEDRMLERNLSVADVLYVTKNVREDMRDNY
jgi:hypothetical protein